MSDEPLKDEIGQEHEVNESGAGNNRWPKLAAVFFFCAMVAGIAYAAYEHTQAQQMAANYSQVGASLSDAQRQIASLTAKLNALVAQAQSAAPAAPTQTAGQEGKTGQSSHSATVAKRRRAEDPRWKKVQSQLDDQQKKLAETQQNLDQARTDLEGKIGESHDELSGTIAKNHDELVNLEKHGERNFYEFDLTRSKQFQRVGPISIALRKANTKHLFCDINLMVDDNMLSKKHVSLYEPVQFFPSDYGQPLQIVIYKIDKDEARGYVSAPKYRQSELSSQKSSSTTASPQPATPSAAAQTAPAKSAELGRRSVPEPQQ